MMSYQSDIRFETVPQIYDVIAKRENILLLVKPQYDKSIAYGRGSQTIWGAEPFAKFEVCAKPL